MAEHTCNGVAVVGDDRFPCRFHEDGWHHFAAHWPACPAPYCKLPPDHRGLHDIPPGKARMCYSARLECLSPGSAEVVAAEADLPEQDHRAFAEGSAVVLAYLDKRYPLDVAGWAFDNGHADDDSASAVIASL
jgi:hypothetical protein